MSRNSLETQFNKLAGRHSLEVRGGSDYTIMEMDEDMHNHTESVVDAKGEHREEIVHEQNLGRFGRLRANYREELAEFIGTLVLVVFGAGSGAQVSLNGGTNGSYISINFGWAFGVLFGVYIAGGISGGHLNPAVTIANAVHNGFPWRKVPRYIAAQVFGAYIGAAIVFANYRSAIYAFDGGARATEGSLATAGIFATYPKSYMTTLGSFFDEFLGTAILLIGLFAIGCPKNLDAPKAYAPIAIFLLIAGIGMSIGSNTAYAINPARDFGPRLLTACAGYGSAPFTAYSGYWWIPIISPIAGAIFGGAVFRAFADYRDVSQMAKETIR
ncbi:glycerol channel, partial [Thoreauomyces humboldtii]